MNAFTWLRGTYVWRYRKSGQTTSPKRGYDNEEDNEIRQLTNDKDSHQMADVHSMPSPRKGRNKIDNYKIRQTLPPQDGCCSIADSPFRLLQLASRGKITELERLYFSDPDRRATRDTRARSPVHLSALNGHVLVLDFLSANGEDLNAQDIDGNTPLHLAVDAGQHDTIDFLITHGANPNCGNHTGNGPIHMAAEKDKAKTLEVLLSHADVDVNMHGQNGCCALHLVAFYNHVDSARILLNYNALMCQKCDVGLYPLHVAAQNGSEDVLDLLIEHADKLGYPKCHVMQYATQERSTPMHVAINGGLIKIVRSCLKAGAPIDVEQEDGNNSVHLAAGQGCLEMIRLMFQYQPEKKDACLQSRNNAKETPLHRAALFNKVDVIDYLVQEGAELNPVNNQCLTPLLVAVDKRAWDAVQALVQHQADITVKDCKGRNMLHLLIMKGAKTAELCFKHCQQVMTTLLNVKDDMGCTPVHYASQEGQMTTLEDLVKLGALLSAKNNSKQAPLHFAAKCGRFNTCKRILNMTDGLNTVNEMDGNGQTPLHQAAENGHTKVVQLLLQKGAGLYRDSDGNTPLHLASQNGYTHSMKAILDLHAHLIDSENKKKETPLHLAAKEGHTNAANFLMTLDAKFAYDEMNQSFLDLAIHNERKDVVVAIVSHDRWREAFAMNASEQGCPFMALIRFMPDVCKMMLDRCQTHSGGDKKSREHYVCFDFHYLQIPMDKVREMRKKGQDYMPLLALNTMVRFNRLECLTHPVTLSYLAMKWSGYGVWFHAINLLIYTIFLASLTTFVATYDFGKLVSGTYTNSHNLTINAASQAPVANSLLCTGQFLLVYIVLAFSILNILKELVQMIQQRWLYFIDLTNVLEWILYITSGIFIAPFVGHMHTTQQWECGALAVFLAWFNLLLFLRRFDIFGIYVVMFLEILKTLVQVLIVFSILIIAFGISFYILLQSGERSFGYKDAGISLMTTSMMMLGNIDYLENWVLPYTDGTLHFSNLNFVMLIVFILLMPILLINLLIGLAVGDIESVKKDAKLKRIAMQVQLHTDLEKKLPQRLIEFVDKTSHTEYPNICRLSFTRLRDRLMKGEVTRVAEEGSSLDIDAENKSYLFQEMHKQKLRMKQMSRDMQKQHELLRLIVQKMDIHTEADDVDEEQHPCTGLASLAARWYSPTLRSTLVRQSQVLANWQK